MRKIITTICIIICLSFILSAFVACDSGKVTETDPPETTAKQTEAPETLPESDPAEGSTESSSESSAPETTVPATTGPETEPVEYELGEDVISFVDYVSSSSRGFANMKADGDYAISFTIPDGQMKELYLTITDKNGYYDCSVNINIYKYDGTYASSVSTDPIYTEYLTTTMRTHTITFPEGTMPAGNYIVVMSYVEPEKDDAESDGETETEYTSLIKDRSWNGKTMPAGYKEYNIKSYTGGKVNKKYTVCGGFLIEHNVVKATTETETEAESEAESDPVENPDKVKVILLSGQSNATGSSYYSYLKNYISDEEYQSYLKGFSNVKILYTNGSNSGGMHYRNCVEDFVDVKLGQGYNTSYFGPEVGLASYLSAKYPDETFYIIKYAIGGVSMAGYFNSLSSNSESYRCLTELKELVYEGLDLIEYEGYDPEIVAMLWMQGESDANTLYNSNNYYILQNALIDNIRNEFKSFASPEGIAFIDAGISNSGFWASWFWVNQIKVQISKQSPLNYYIDTNAHGLTTLYDNDDYAHYDATSMLLLGELYGQKIAEFLEK